MPFIMSICRDDVEAADNDTDDTVSLDGSDSDKENAAEEDGNIPDSPDLQNIRPGCSNSHRELWVVIFLNTLTNIQARSFYCWFINFSLKTVFPLSPNSEPGDGYPRNSETNVKHLIPRSGTNEWEATNNLPPARLVDEWDNMSNYYLTDYMIYDSNYELACLSRIPVRRSRYGNDP